MIPSCETLLAGLRFYARRHRLPARYDEPAIAAALGEAQSLAREEREEPAALFFACSRRSRAFCGTAGQLVPMIARAHARAIGVELGVEDLEMEILRARVLLGAVDFAEIRERFLRS
ncbi:MAG: hypothetical protein R3F14_16050 [Polyangiaceae bacterium]